MAYLGVVGTGDLPVIPGILQGGAGPATGGGDGGAPAFRGGADGPVVAPHIEEVAGRVPVYLGRYVYFMIV